VTPVCLHRDLLDPSELQTLEFVHGRADAVCIHEYPASWTPSPGAALQRCQGYRNPRFLPSIYDAACGRNDPEEYLRFRLGMAEDAFAAILEFAAIFAIEVCAYAVMEKTISSYCVFVLTSSPYGPIGRRQPAG